MQWDIPKATSHAAAQIEVETDDVTLRLYQLGDIGRCTGVSHVAGKEILLLLERTTNGSLKLVQHLNYSVVRMSANFQKMAQPVP